MGRVRISDWSSPTLLLQAAWGLLFCVRGFSHAALRLSTAVLSIGSVALAHRWFLRAGLPRASAALAGAVLAVNPVFLNLSLTFMTDVPFLFMCLVFFNLVTREEGEADPWLCGLAAAAAGLIRQPGALLSLGYAAYLYRRRSLTLMRFVALAVPPLLTMGAYEYWLTRIHGATWAHYWYNTLGTLGRLLHPSLIAKDALPRIGWIIFYSGLASLPLALPRLASAPPRRRLAALLLVAAAAYPALLLFPDPEATLNPLGLGRWFALGRGLKAAGPLSEPWVWKATAMAGLLSVFAIASDPPRLDRRVLPAAFAAAPLLLWLFIGVEFYDRYLIMLLPFMLLPAVSGKASWVLCGALAVFSAVGEADYLDCHEAFWSAARSLEARGYPRDSIWATSEYVLWHGYQTDMDRLKGEKRLFDIDDNDWLKLAAQRRRAIISFPGAPRRKGYVKTGEAEYLSPLSMKREKLFVFELQ